MKTFNAQGTSLHYRYDAATRSRASESRSVASNPLTGAPSPTLVFANSLGTDLRIWDAMLDYLPSDWGRLCYDKPGHGLSDNADGLTIADHADCLSALMQHCGIERATLVGLSVGGQIAQSLAAVCPEQVDALVLMDTAHRIGPADMWNARIASIREGGIASLSDAVLERWFTARFRQHDSGFPAWRNMLERTRVESYLSLCAAIRDTDLTTTTRKLTLPVLCVCGSDDGATPPTLVRELCDLIADADYLEIADAGHLPCIEQPRTTADAIIDFVLSLKRREERP